MALLQVSSSPHINTDDSVKKIMLTVIIALLPTLIFSFLFFGWGAVKVTLVAIAACVIFEWLFLKLLPETKPSYLATIVTGMLLAFNLPTNLPIWIVIIGALVAIGLGKMVYGGLGNNLFNPALVGRVFLLISFPQQMTTWPKPRMIFTNPTLLTDATTEATPLGAIKTGLSQGQDMTSLMESLPTYAQLLIGERGGSLGEVASLAIIIGGLIMLFRKVISWHIPVSFIGASFLLAAVLHWINPGTYIPPSYHILSGGLLLGAIFMATDMVTSPMSAWGKIIFGIGCGILTIVIRVAGAYPEGVSFAILFMNALVPLINKGFKPKRFGVKNQKIYN
mgnify:CR=1 FL=1